MPWLSQSIKQPLLSYKVESHYVSIALTVLLSLMCSSESTFHLRSQTSSKNQMYFSQIEQDNSWKFVVKHPPGHWDTHYLSTLIQLYIIDFVSDCYWLQFVGVVSLFKTLSALLYIRFMMLVVFHCGLLPWHTNYTKYIH